MPSNNKTLLNEQLTAIIIKFQNHSSITKINSKYNFQEKFSFNPENVIKNIPNSKASRGELAIHIPKQSGFTYHMLTDCINDALPRSIFQYNLKFTNISHIHKNDEATDKEN